MEQSIKTQAESMRESDADLEKEQLRQELAEAR